MDIIEQVDQDASRGQHRGHLRRSQPPGLLYPPERAALAGQVAFQALLAVAERVELLEPCLSLPGRWSRESQVGQASAGLLELPERLFQLGPVAGQAVLVLAGLDHALPGQDVAIDLLALDPGGGCDAEVAIQRVRCSASKRMRWRSLRAVRTPWVHRVRRVSPWRNYRSAAVNWPW